MSVARARIPASDPPTLTAPLPAPPSPLLQRTSPGPAPGQLLIQAPPLSQRAVALPGPYMLFLIGADTGSGRTYSQAAWLRLADAA
jgi:hypothetical protein